jgi:parallel beta-helix repeat protein
MLNARQVKAEPKTWTVDDDGQADFSKIQEAINAASDGDTILVKPGAYYENLEVANNVSLVAESQDAVINGTGGSGGLVVRITAKSASVNGFTITGSATGVFLFGNYKPNENTTSRVHVHTVVSRNRIVDVKDVGVYVYWSNGSLVTENTFINSTKGIYSYNSNATITRNLFENNTYGIDSNLYALDTAGGRIPVCSENIFRNNIYSIYLGWSQAPTEICRNSFINNAYGIFIDRSGASNTIYHNNFINNTQNAQIYEWTKNTWDKSYPIGGNYWSNYTGSDIASGLYQNETGSDGIGDTPFLIDESNRDNYPLIAPISVFDAGSWNGTAYSMNVESNSTVSGFQLNVTDRSASFEVAGLDHTSGFCRITIPNAVFQNLWQDGYKMLLDGEPLTCRSMTDAVNTFIYVNYTHSQHVISIKSESSLSTIRWLPIVLVAIALVTIFAIVAFVAARRKSKR